MNDICQTCPAGTYKTNLTAGNSCVHKSFIPTLLPAHGVDEENRLVVACSEHCLACLDDYRVCSKCDDQTRLAIISCIDKDLQVLPLKLKEAVYVRATKTATLVFSRNIRTSFDLSKLSLELIDEVNERSIRCSIGQNLMIRLDEDRIISTFNLDESLLFGTLVVRSLEVALVRSASGDASFEDYPVQLTSIQIAGSSAKESEIASAASETISALSSGAILIAVSSNPALALMLIKLMNNYLILAVQNSIQLYYPQLFLDAMLDIGLLPFERDRM